MSIESMHCVVLRCDVCETHLIGSPFQNAKEARAVARTMGWTAMQAPVPGRGGKILIDRCAACVAGV